MNKLSPPQSPPSHDDFRETGFSGSAVDYPRNELAFKMLCAFNGIEPEQAPATWWYHPNSATKAAWERVAKAAMEHFENGGN